MESREDWAEIMDSRLTGACNLEELGDMANIAYKCVGAEGRRRPKMRAVAQSLCNLARSRPESIMWSPCLSFVSNLLLLLLHLHLHLHLPFPEGIEASRSLCDPSSSSSRSSRSSSSRSFPKEKLFLLRGESTSNIVDVLAPQSFFYFE